MKKFSRLVLILVIVTFLGGIGSYFYDRSKVEPLYESVAQLYVVPGEKNEASIRANNGGLNNDFMIIFKSNVVMTAAKKEAGTSEDISQYLTVTSPDNSNIVEIKCINPDQNTAKKYVDAVAKTAIKTTSIIPVNSIQILSEGTSTGEVIKQDFTGKTVKKTIVIAVVCLIIEILYILIINAFKPKEPQAEYDDEFEYELNYGKYADLTDEQKIALIDFKKQTDKENAIKEANKGTKSKEDFSVTEKIKELGKKETDQENKESKSLNIKNFNIKKSIEKIKNRDDIDIEEFKKNNKNAFRTDASADTAVLEAFDAAFIEDSDKKDSEDAILKVDENISENNKKESDKLKSSKSKTNKIDKESEDEEYSEVLKFNRDIYTKNNVIKRSSVDNDKNNTTDETQKSTQIEDVSEAETTGVEVKKAQEAETTLVEAEEAQETETTVVEAEEAQEAEATAVEEVVQETDATAVEAEEAQENDATAVAEEVQETEVTAEVVEEVSEAVTTAVEVEKAQETATTAVAGEVQETDATAVETEETQESESTGEDSIAATQEEAFDSKDDDSMNILTEETKIFEVSEIERALDYTKKWGLDSQSTLLNQDVSKTEESVEEKQKYESNEEVTSEKEAEKTEIVEKVETSKKSEETEKIEEVEESEETENVEGLEKTEEIEKTEETEEIEETTNNVPEAEQDNNNIDESDHIEENDISGFVFEDDLPGVRVLGRIPRD